ncbi:MAG: DsbE family thiol:disulfide interchange protein [Candidatus Methylophosphatis roskildensis]
MGRYLIPLGIFIVLVGFLAVGLNLNPREVPSPLIGKPAPAFSLPVLDESGKTIARDELRGKVWLLNVWASWCVSCRAEHPVLVELANRKAVPIYGLNYKEVRGDGSLDARRMAPADELALARSRASQWLKERGNPYVASLLDLDGRVGIDYGVYGVPETFLIDKNGVIRYKHIGPVTPDAVRNVILPKVKELNAAS